MSRVHIHCVSALVVVFSLWGTACSAPVGGKEQQSEMVLTWGRYGGVAGFCDEMQVSASGEVRVQSCRNKSEKTGKLSSDDSRRLDEWKRSFGSVVIESKDGAVADAMSVMLTLNGTGKTQPTDMQRREILEWAQTVFGKMGS